MKGHIVVGVDDSSEAATALEWALEEADLRHAEVEVVHAYWFSYGGEIYVSGRATLHDKAAALMRSVESAAAAHPRVHVTRRLAEGSPAHVLIQAAANADLLVVGSRTRGGFAGSLLASVSDHCVHHANCPVVMVCAASPNNDPSVEDPYTVVVGVDGSPTSRKALQWAIGEAGAHQGQVRVIHAWRSPYEWQLEVAYPHDEEKLRARAEERLEETMGSLDPGDVTVDVELVEGDPRQILTQAARSANLLVVGSPEHGRLAGMLRGSVSSFCTHRASAPVVVVRGEPSGLAGTA